MKSSISACYRAPGSTGSQLSSDPVWFAVGTIGDSIMQNFQQLE